MLAVPQRLVQADFNPGAEAEIGYAYDDSLYINWGRSDSEKTGFWAASADGAYLLRGYAVPAVYVFGAQCAFWVSATNAA